MTDIDALIAQAEKEALFVEGGTQEEYKLRNLLGNVANILRVTVKEYAEKQNLIDDLQDQVNDLEMDLGNSEEELEDLLVTLHGLEDRAKGEE